MTHDLEGRQSELWNGDKNDSVGTKKEPICNIFRVIRATQTKTLSKFIAEIHSAMWNYLQVLERMFQNLVLMLMSTT